jgi:hypothetical protein
MSFEFLKIDYQLLETGLQTSSSNFFKTIAKNQFLYIKNQCIPTGPK